MTERATTGGISWAILAHFVRQDLVDRYAGSVLGGLWSLINPLANILIFTLIFSKVMGAKIEMLGSEAFATYSYSIYLVSALLGWNAFLATTTRLTAFFKENAGLIGKVPVSIPWLPLYVLISDAVIYVISMAFFAVFLLAIGFPITWHWALLPLIFVVQQLLAYGLGFGAGTLAVFIPDVRDLVGIVLQFWFWLTPVVYVVTILPEWVQGYYAWNPIYQIVTAYRDVIMHHQLPDGSALALLAVVALGIAALALWGFRRLEHDLRDLI
ncbi:MAG: ABC transporter permease [Halorhodospira sp.]